MEAYSYKDVEGKKVKTAEYKGKTYEVKGVTIRWLSKSGKDSEGQPEYGLRHFTVEPGGEIPCHNHLYLQTMFIERGQVECFSYDPETDKVVANRICGPGDYIFSPSMEPHGLRNTSKTDAATFLCCICSLYDDEDTI